MQKSNVFRGLMACTAMIAVSESALASDWGSFDGVTIEAKLIGGQQYEGLYGRIAEWEEATGAKVDIISKKSHFEIDKEIKSDMAAGTTGWCVGSNHSSFAPQYEGLYADLNDLISADVVAGFVQGNIGASTIGGELLMLPRAQFDVSVLYYLKSNYEDADKAAAFKAEYGYDLAVPETWDQVKDQSIFFADPPNFYGTQYAGKDEAIVGRFYEMVVAEGGNYLDENKKPIFNSDAGQRALQWFVDLYEAKAVPAGTTSYVWDDLGQGFASGTVALNLDWPGWAESAGGSLPTRTAVWEANVAAAQAGDDAFRAEALAAFAEGAKYAFAVPPIPEWGESTNIVFPELQAAIVGDKTVKEALDDAAEAVDELMRESGYY